MNRVPIPRWRVSAATAMRVTLGVLLSVLVSLSARADLVEPDTEYLVFHHRDVLGTAIVSTDSNGNVVHHTSTTPYGRDLGRRADDGQGFSDNAYPSSRSGEGYTGHVNDRQLELTYMRARFYDPVLGRFLSNDPVGFTNENPTSFNRYAYANNNPYRYVDPDGRWAEDLFIGLPSVGIGLYSLGSNVWNGNWGAAALDAGGIVADVGAILTPGAPGVAGLSIKAGRLADAAKAADKATDVPDGGKMVYHYTDEAGAAGIAKSGTIKPDAKGRVYVTEEKVSAADANNAFFAGQGGTKGSHRVDIEFNQGANLRRGDQPNEQIHSGSVRNGRQGNFEVKDNDF